VDAKTKKERSEVLLGLRDQIYDQIRTLSSSSLRANRSAGEELADVGSDDFIREIELSLVGEEQKTFLLINEAIERLDDGSYGSCIDCGGTISDGRLKAIPYAKLCVECKAAREANDGLPPDEIEEETADELVE